MSDRAAPRSAAVWPVRALLALAVAVLLLDGIGYLPLLGGGTPTRSSGPSSLPRIPPGPSSVPAAARTDVARPAEAVRAGAVTVSDALARALRLPQFTPVGLERPGMVSFDTHHEDTPIVDGDDDPGNDRSEMTEWMAFRLEREDSADARIQVGVWWVDAKGELHEAGSTWADREDAVTPALSVQLSYPTEEFPDVEVIAVFEAHDVRGEVRFRAVRTLRTD